MSTLNSDNMTTNNTATTTASQLTSNLATPSPTALLTNPQLNSATLSKALIKPPSLSSVLQMPLNRPPLLNGTGSGTSSPLTSAPLTTPTNMPSSFNAKLLPPAQTGPQIGSTLLAQTKLSQELQQQAAASLLNRSPLTLNSTNGTPPPMMSSHTPTLMGSNQLNLSNSLPASSGAKLFHSNLSDSNLRQSANSPATAPVLSTNTGASFMFNSSLSSNQSINTSSSSLNNSLNQHHSTPQQFTNSQTQFQSQQSTTSNVSNNDRQTPASLNQTDNLTNTSTSQLFQANTSSSSLPSAHSNLIPNRPPSSIQSSINSVPVNNGPLQAGQMFQQANSSQQVHQQQQFSNDNQFATSQSNFPLNSSQPTNINTNTMPVTSNQPFTHQFNPIMNIAPPLQSAALSQPPINNVQQQPLPQMFASNFSNGTVAPTSNFHNTQTIPPPMGSSQPFNQPPVRPPPTVADLNATRQQQQQQQQIMAQPPLGPPSSSFNAPPLGPPPLGSNVPPMGPPQSNFNAPPLGQPKLNQPPLNQPQYANQPSIGPPPTNKPPFNQPLSTGPPPPLPPTPLQTSSQQPTLNQPSFNQPTVNPPQYSNLPPTNYNQPQAHKDLSNQFNNMSISNSNNMNNKSNMNQTNDRNQPRAVDLLREKRLLSAYPEKSDQPPRPILQHDFYNSVNCSSDIVRCTLTSIPESQSVLNKCRLPLGILIHPFKDLESLKVVQSSTIVRCRSCRSYINPFVNLFENSKWRCNMCYSINDLPDEFLFDPVTRTYGDPSKRPEINSSTIEFIAPPEYTLRPPPPTMYLYLLDVSHNAINTGYLHSFCETLLECLERIPGDSRTQIGFITYNSAIHFYNLSDALSQPRMMIYPDLDELVLPLPDSLMVNLSENKESIQQFLQWLPTLFADTNETDSALGSALTIAHQLLKQTGGRITVMQTCMPNVGVGALKYRDETVEKEANILQSQTDFYKKLALDCALVHIAVDLFMFNTLYADLATLSCISKFSGGEFKYYPAYHLDQYPEQVVRYCVDLKRYLTRKIGLEAVMRLRCTRGLSIHTFHGNFFVRSTDLLALPNVNPDAGFGMQITIDESLSDISTVCFQTAILYTSSKSERRIRIHTYCLPVTKNINELVNGADQECIIGLISKMAVDRITMSSLKEAKEGLINVAVDYIQAYSQHMVSSQYKNNALLSPYQLRLVPLYVLALIKNVAFKSSNSKADDRTYAMNIIKTMPLKYLMLFVYPDLYALHNIDDTHCIIDSSETEISIPPRVQLSSENIDRHGVYLMDCGESIYMWVGRSVSDLVLQQVFGCKSFNELPDHSNDLPELENQLSEKIRNFLVYLYDNRPFGPTFMFFREDSQKSSLFFQHMHDDRSDSSLSYYEFLRYLNEQISK